MFKNILVATDGSPHGQKAVQTAVGIAIPLDAALTLVTIVGQGDVPENMVKMLEMEHLIEEEKTTDSSLGRLSYAPWPAVRVDLKAVHAAEIHQKMAEMILDDASQQVKDAGLKRFEAHLERGDPASVILELAKQSKSDLIIVGSRGFGDLKNLIMGSVSHKVLQLAECPCMIVK